VGAWVLAASFLWPTSVPGDLHIPHLDQRHYFDPGELRRTRDYEAFLRLLTLLSAATLLVVVALYARHGARFVRESAAGRIGTGMLLGMLGLGFLWLARLPFAVVTLWWDRRHHISKQGYVDLLVGDWLGLSVIFVSACVVVLVVMALAARFPRRWWLLAAPVFVAIGLAGTFLQPYLMEGDLHRLRKPAIEADARRLERSEGVTGIPVKVQKVHDRTTEPNAEAIGIGPSRRVVLWDTLLDGRFGRKQISVVLGHELGHQARHHILKGVGWYGLFALPLLYLVAEVTRRRRGGLHLAEAVPLALLVVVVLQTVTLPLANVVSRRIEAEADWVALQHTRDPASARALFQNLSKASLSEPRPPTWAYVLLDDHPTIVQRMAMANAWQARNPGSRPVALGRRAAIGSAP
jgi:STE24 endopeptidase